MQLRTCPPGVEVEVVSLGLHEAALLRAGELGLRVGSTLRVLHRGPLGARVIALGGARLAIDGGTAAGVEVRSLS
ncbi:ferrous iron transport protein A [Actinotalea sp. M2MS4P-6]|uniref:FeoA family protein n=1 Tax=Actinotalea sp. M2MS4P-6 TaxID=2983762 RepID=UPI0021E4C628|nr:FeoA family protein [Actinotalea sp. M2MS4P-6]MCV2396303.1 ferrous iron transport protein A [Actinotalea sp. M2MS4P-6]